MAYSTFGRKLIFMNCCEEDTEIHFLPREEFSVPTVEKFTSAIDPSLPPI